MGLTLSQVETRITAIEDAISTGHLQVSYADKTVRYRDEAHMHNTLAWLEKKREELGGAPRIKKPRQYRAVTRDGW